MFHDNDQYTLHRKVDGGGFTHYYISYTDEQGEAHDTRVSREVFAAYLRFEKDERNLRRWNERHREQRDLSDAEISARALRQPHSIENVLIDTEQRKLLWQAIAGLPEIQRRRLLMYHVDGMTYEEIADSEDCTKRAVKFSVDIAEEKVKNFLSS